MQAWNGRDDATIFLQQSPMAEIKWRAMDITDNGPGFLSNDAACGMIPDLLDVSRFRGETQVCISLPACDQCVLALTIETNWIADTTDVFRNAIRIASA